MANFEILKFTLFLVIIQVGFRVKTETFSAMHLVTITDIALYQNYHFG